MKFELFFMTCVIEWCFGVRLNPLENNDKLQDVTNLYVAEWQWESWPVKQDVSEQGSRSPTQRKNVALWKDTSGSAWYLFGGQPVNGDPTKVYSDVWKFTVKTRAWKRLFPNQTNAKEAGRNKTGEVMPFLTNLLSEKNAFYFNLALKNLVLCGGSKKSNSTKVKKLKKWNSLKRKLEAEETEEKLTSLAVYAPKTPRANTVWQIDAKSKLWTTYVCCCDTIKNKAVSNSSSDLVNEGKMSNANQTLGKEIKKNSNTAKNKSSVIDPKISKAEDEVENEKQNLKNTNLKSKKRKVNQMRNNGDKSYYKIINIEKRGNDKIKSNETKIYSQKFTTVNESKNVDRINSTKGNTTHEEEETLAFNNTEGRNRTQKTQMLTKPKVASKYCPEFSESGLFVSWCDGKNEAILTSDISFSRVTLWLFNLSTSHWSQLQVKLSDGVQWPACSDMNSVRYAGSAEEVYIACSQTEGISPAFSQKSAQNSTDYSKIPSKDSFNLKLVFRINYKERVLQDLGNIRLNSYFNSPEGEKIWRNESQTILQVIRNSENETILILAYLDMVDLWVLSKDHEGKERLHLVEKIWRGSAMKWFDKYNAALYSLQFVSESGSSETILLPNPRNIEVNEYWPRERGRFIIRTFRNENLKNQTFENRAREQNLTYELLQSDYKPSGSENQISHIYGLKAFIFFGISLGIFAAFGTVLFLKKCVNCPPRIRVRNECHKSPLVIRYSVIPDDMLYPMA